MIRILGTVFAGLLGLAFGSFLNVCLTRWPRGESIVHPRSHCRGCGHSLAWWENVPLLSWLALRGRCRSCRAWIGWRYPLVEILVGILWTIPVWNSLDGFFDPGLPRAALYRGIFTVVGQMAFYWLLIALSVLDFEQLWLPNRLTYPGIVAGFAYNLLHPTVVPHLGVGFRGIPNTARQSLMALLAIFIAAGLILLIRWVYWLLRRQEGIGLGDAKLMAMLAAWLGLPGALLAFGTGVGIGAAVALVLLPLPAARRNPGAWALQSLPFGSFLCVGGLVSSLWGERIIAAYLRWAGF